MSIYIVLEIKMTEPSEGPPKAEVPKEKNELLDSCLNYYTHAMTKLRDGHVSFCCCFWVMLAEL